MANRTHEPTRHIDPSKITRPEKEPWRSLLGKRVDLKTGGKYVAGTLIGELGDYLALHDVEVFKDDREFTPCGREEFVLIKPSRVNFVSFR